MTNWIFNPVTKDPKISIGLLVFRVGIGSMMLTHGIPKLLSISEKFYTFSDPLGIGSPLSYLGTVSGEFLSAIAIILGFATRIGTSILGFTMCVAALTRIMQ